MSSYTIDSPLTVSNAGTTNIKLDNTTSLVKWNVATDGSDNLLVGTNSIPNALHLSPGGVVESSRFRFSDSVDPTKEMQFDLSSIPPATLITLAVPSGSTSLGTVTSVATGTGLTGGPITSTGTISISTVPVANGGTGQTSYTDGQLLIGKSLGNTLNKTTLTSGGTGIGITNGSGTITLDNTMTLTDSTPGNPAANKLVKTGTGPTLVIKGLLAGAGCILTDVGGNNISIAAAGGGGGTVTAVNPGTVGAEDPAGSGLVFNPNIGITNAGSIALAVPVTIAYGGTNSVAALSNNRVMVSSGGAIVELASAGTTTTVLHGNAGGAPSFGAVNLATDVTSILPIANGGTNSSSALANGKLMISSAGTIIEGTSSSSPTFSSATLSSVTNQLTLGAGGSTTTITSPAPSVSRTYTLPDTGANSSFVMTDGSQTINGATNLLSAGYNISSTSTLYSTGTAGTGGVPSTTVTGSGTAWAASMTGGIIKFSTGTVGYITAINSTTSLTVSISITVAGGTSYTIGYGAYQQYDGGVGVQTLNVPSLSTNQAVYLDSNYKLSSIGAGTTTQVLHGNASGAPVYGAVNLTTDVSGILPIANGGTGGAGGAVTSLTGTTNQITTSAATGAVTLSTPVIFIAPGTIQDSTGMKYSTTTGITALGTTQGTAAALTTSYNVVTTVASSTGVVLPTASSGLRVVVVNRGANTLNVYPASGASIDGASVNVAVTISTNSTATYEASSATQWYTVEVPVVAGTGLSATYGNGMNSIALTSPVSAANGGTGQTSYTIGDLLYASGSSTLSKLSDVATGSVLISGGVGIAPSYGQAVLTSAVTGILPIANGGTNSSTALSGSSILISNGTQIVQGAAGTTTTLLHGNASGSPTYSAVSLTADVSGILPIANGGTNSSTALSGNSIMISNGTQVVQGTAGTTTTVLHGNAAGSPTYGAVSLTADVSGILPVANGGTNSSSTLSGSSIMVSDGTKVIQGSAGTTTTLLHGNAAGTPTYSAVSLTADVTGTLPIANGGTNSSSALSGSSIMISNGTSVIQGTAGTTTTVLHGNAAGSPTYAAVSLTADISGTLPAANGGTGLSSYTIGDLIYASGSSTLSKLADVATGSVLISGGVGVAPSYGQAVLTSAVTGILPIANGGTNSSSALSGNSIMISNGTQVVQGTAGTTTTVLHGNAGGSPTYGAVSLTADVSGTLPVASGGTNQTSYTDGQLLIGNTSGNTLTKATLTQGTGITITNGNGSITIASSSTGVQATSFTSGTAATWSIPAGTKYCSFFLVGAGGGGGGSGAGGNAIAAGAGGGGGAVIQNYTLLVGASTSVTYTVGVKGSGGAAGASGTVGTDTSVTMGTATVTAYGGGNGSANVASSGGTGGGGGGSNGAGSNGTAGTGSATASATNLGIYNAAGVSPTAGGTGNGASVTSFPVVSFYVMSGTAGAAAGGTAAGVAKTGGAGGASLANYAGGTGGAIVSTQSGGGGGGAGYQGRGGNAGDGGVAGESAPVANSGAGGGGAGGKAGGLAGGNGSDGLIIITYW